MPMYQRLGEVPSKRHTQMWNDGRLITEQVRHDEAARRVYESLRKAPKGRLTDEQAMKLADEAKHAGYRDSKQ